MDVMQAATNWMFLIALLRSGHKLTMSDLFWVDSIHGISITEQDNNARLYYDDDLASSDVSSWSPTFTSR